jgi:cytochrome c biogenesis protein CcmG/thiol:disulfide interchange protein DsbE
MARRPLQLVAVAFVLGLLAVLIWKVVHNPSSPVIRAEESGTIIPAPTFTKARVDTSGTLSLASLRGKVVVLNFWQSYCAPCTAEARTLSDVAKRWQGKGVVFLGVDEQDLRGPALKYLKRFDITYPIIADNLSLTTKYGVTGYPETFFINARGQVIPLPPTHDSICKCTQSGHIVGGADPATLDAGIKQALTE